MAIRKGGIMSNIKLPQFKYDAFIKELQDYFENERGESIGVLQARLLLDFIIENIGPAIYNLAIADMQKYLFDKIEDLYEFER